MNFTGKQVESKKTLVVASNDGYEFFHKTTVSSFFPGRTEITAKVVTTSTCIHYPVCDTPDTSLKTLKEIYRGMYGPCSVEELTEKIFDILNKINDAKKIANNERRFVRKLWLYKQIFELFHSSMNLIITGLPKIVDLIYEKSLELFDYFEKNKNKYVRPKKYITIALSVIQKVKIQIVDIIAGDAKLLKLLSPRLLRLYVTNASPYMVAKFGSLPWIEPDIVLLIAREYNFYWTDFWRTFFRRNFNISEELIFIIAEYMPKYLVGETFLDYFRRKYYAGQFKKIQKSTRYQGNYNVCKITICI